MATPKKASGAKKKPAAGKPAGAGAAPRKPAARKTEARAARSASGTTVKVRQIRSGIGFERNQKATLRSLGFTRLNQVVELPDNPAVRGMIYTVRHLVEVVGAAHEGGGRA